ncbi:MAG: (Fe-S)-binding protein [Spirochaetales bacterium]
MQQNLTMILYTFIVSFSLALVLGFLLGFFQKIFYVPVDEKALKIKEVLPGVNCGACGYPGCEGFANAVSSGEAPVTGCLVGGPKISAMIGDIIKSMASEGENT